MQTETQAIPLVREMDAVDAIYTRAGKGRLFDDVTRRFVLEAANHLSESFLVQMMRNAKDNAIRLFTEVENLEEVA